jgi:predicted transposase/invertase (TIGR01784 family)
MTAPYKINEKTREIYKDEVLISALNPKNLKGIERKIFNHELIYLNPNYNGADTPQNYRDWLDLIYESIHNPENPQINIQNAGIKRVTEIANYENISPEEWEQAKIEASKRKVIKLEREAGQDEAKIEIEKKMLKRGTAIAIIAEDTGLPIEQIQNLQSEKE